MKINQKGIELIKSCEGCVLHAYKALSSEKFYTIGFGHYGITDPNMTITQDEADALLSMDLEQYENIVETVSNKYNYDFNENEFSALVSFAYNIGGINQLTQNGKRSKEEIADAMLLYNKAGGKVLNGLVKRRKLERELFLTPIENSHSNVYSESTTLGEVVDDIIAGDFGNGEIRKNNIYKVIQNLVNARLNS